MLPVSLGAGIGSGYISLLNMKQLSLLSDLRLGRRVLHMPGANSPVTFYPYILYWPCGLEGIYDIVLLGMIRHS
jgi:hypothetical protein